MSAMFDHAVLAIPPAQAAVLLAALKMNPCWTLMVLTDHI
jgi:hypothetical protein